MLYGSRLNKLASSIKQALSGDAVGGVEPGLSLDFVGEAYKISGGSQTFDQAVTYANSGNATMVDSDGLLKWAPHNLLPDSTTLDSVSWTQTVTMASGVSDPDGGAGAYTLTATSNSQLWLEIVTLAGGEYTRGIWVRRRTGTGDIRLYSADGAQVITAITTAWQKFDSTGTTVGGNMYAGVVIDIAGDEVDVYAPHLYRSDLGGMVNNPSRGDSYVPTTSAAVYLPRTGHHKYNGSEWVNKGLLAESEARTNLVTYSEDFGNAAWTKNSVTISQDVIGPDGETSGWTMVATADTNIARVVESFTVATSTSYVFSVYAKAGTVDFLYLFPVVFTTPSNAAGVYFDLANGTVGLEQNTAEVVGSIEDAGNGWYRCSIHILTTDAVDTTGDIRVQMTDADGNTFCSNGGSLSIYGAQLEAGSVPSSYILTAGATGTRAAETFTVPSANLPWSSDAVSIEMKGEMDYFDDDAISMVEQFQWYLNSLEYIKAYMNGVGARTGQQVFSQRDTVSGLDLVDSVTYYTPGLNVPFNIASRHGSTFINGAVEGVALTANTTPTALSDLSATDLVLAYDFMGTVERFRVWDEDLGDSGIVEASAP